MKKIIVFVDGKMFSGFAGKHKYVNIAGSYILLNTLHKQGHAITIRSARS